jgi:hypothetical protein
VDSHPSRPPLAAADAIALLRAQVASGEELRQFAVSAPGLTEIKAARPRLSSWSARNEQVLATIFGPADRDAYRASFPKMTSGRSFVSQQTTLLVRIDARLGYLRVALMRASQPSYARGVTTAASPKRRWRAFLLNPWTVGVGTSLIVVALLAARSTLVSLFTGNGSVTGTVICESGRPVVGVWIAASSGQRDSGWAHLGAGYPGHSTVTYSYQLGNDGSYSVHVGCGGTTSDWASSNYSPTLHARSVILHCDDHVAVNGQGAAPDGSCAS